MNEWKKGEGVLKELHSQLFVQVVKKLLPEENNQEEAGWVVLEEVREVD